ncbi:hypothetical protein OKW50_004266 [Paraburkholderia youngii]|uniref:Uncharacterized protein n=1 Tax=Paraburkholderia youngii TaxID=2782701 RepID=A0A7Y6MY38_9BURK|nr:hypothetical protein [Paraburkholderia youngii]NUX98893.1 hypothetical protein [Paraburkholderia youngii]NVI09692.1 hypothetical protein [Paraburkholderia youngii]
MAAGIQSLSEQQIALFRKEGRGAGEGADYVPGQAQRDMSGIGRLRRFACARCGGRQIVLASDVELSVFLDEYWDPCTRDLHEYMPLIDVAKTVQLAGILGAGHPELSDGSPAMLMTSLMVCKRRAGSYKWEAIDVVSSPDAQREPSDENRIKGEYWKRLGVAHRVVHSRGLNSPRARHLWFLFNVAELIVNRGLSQEQRLAQRAVLERLRLRQGVTLLAVCHAAADARGIPRSACVAAMHELIALRIVECSLDVPVLLSQKRQDSRVRLSFERLKNRKVPS